MATFWATFGKNWATFYSNIWSHWSLAEWVREKAGPFITSRAPKRENVWGGFLVEEILIGNDNVEFFIDSNRSKPKRRAQAAWRDGLIIFLNIFGPFTTMGVILNCEFGKLLTWGIFESTFTMFDVLWSNKCMLFVRSGSVMQRKTFLLLC